MNCLILHLIGQFATYLYRRSYPILFVVYGRSGNSILFWRYSCRRWQREVIDSRKSEGSRVIYEFGPFQLRPEEQQLLRDGETIVLGHRAFSVLEFLVQRPGQLVDKTELLNEVWGDCCVEEGNLPVAISSLRKALGDPRNEQHYIKTVPGRGYRFVAPIHTVSLSGSAAIADVLPQGPSIPAVKTRPCGKDWRRVSRFALPASLLLLLGVGLTIWWQSRGAKSLPSASSIHSLAVLPFKNASRDNAYGKLNIDIAEDLIERFGEDGSIAVRPLGAVLKYVDHAVEPSVVGSQLQVDAVLTGTFVAENGNLKVSTGLVRVKDGEILWTGAITVPIDQTQILASRLENSLSPSLFPARTVVSTIASGTQNPEAHRLYLEGRYFWNKRTEDGIRRGIDDFQKATEKDPGYALAYAGLSDSYSSLAIRNVRAAGDLYPHAEAAAIKALELDPKLAEAHATLGIIALYHEWDHFKGEQELKRAIQLNPSWSTPHSWYAADLAAAAQLEQALREALRAQELDPVSPVAAAEVGRIYYWSRQYDKAATAYRRALDLDPLFPAAHTWLGTVYLMQKKYSEATQELQKAKIVFKDDREIDALLAYTESASGNPKAARKMLESLIHNSARGYVSAYSVTLVYVSLGDNAEALRWLSKCRQQRPAHIIFARIDPLFDPIRLDPGFSAAMAEVGLSADK